MFTISVTLHFYHVTVRAHSIRILPHDLMFNNISVCVTSSIVTMENTVVTLALEN